MFPPLVELPATPSAPKGGHMSPTVPTSDHTALPLPLWTPPAPR